MDRRGSYQIGFYHGGVGMSLRWTSVESVINWISYFCILYLAVCRHIEPCFAQSPELTVQEPPPFFSLFFFFWRGGGVHICYLSTAVVVFVSFLFV